MAEKEEKESQRHTTSKLEAVVVPRPDARREPDEAGSAPTAEDFVSKNITSEAAFMYLSGQMSEIAALCRGTKSEVTALTVEVVPRLARLEIRVFGSNLPPLSNHKSTPPGELDIEFKPSTPPLVSRMKTSENTTDMLAQEVSNLRSDLQNTRDEIKNVSEMNVQQSKAMGIAPADVSRGKKTRAYLGSRAAVKDLLAIITAIGVVIGLWRGLTAPPAPAPAPALVAPSHP